VRLRWKVLLGLLAALAVLLGLNAIVLDQETEQAEVTVPGGRILSLSGGDLQVVDLEQLPAASSASRPGAAGSRAGRGSPSSQDSSPIVLLHCYTCAIDWWDGLIPLLRRHHRVIAIDLLGHGGSEKPSSGYSMPDQADLIAEALGRLGVRGATVVGHSLGGTVATALAQQSPRLVSRLVLIDQAPDNSYGQLGLLARLTYWPVLGEALWRLSPDAAIKDALSEAFAPGFDVPDPFVEDVRRMTFNAYDTVGADEDDYTKEEPLDARIRASRIPLLAIFGSEDQIYDAREAISAYAAIRGARTALIAGAGHSPNVEKPEQVARLIDGFAAPEPEGGRSGTSLRSVVTQCDAVTIGPGPSDWRRQAAVAGPFGLFGSGRDFTRADRIGPGTFETKIPAIVEGHRRVVLSVPNSEQEEVGLLWGPTALRGGQHRVDDGFDRIVFVPCAEKPRTVWPGGLLLASRKRISLRVSVAGRTRTLRVG
jgi:pimeloyl-ACP methyl ester carboxylesterase